MGKLVKAAIVVAAAVILIVGTGGLAAPLVFLGKLVVLAGATIIADVFAPKFDDVRQGGLREEIRSPIAPRNIAYGTSRLAGAMVYAGTHGTDNKFVTMVFVVAAIEIDSFQKWYLNDLEVSLDGSGFVNSGRYNGKVRITSHLGTDAQTADTAMVSDITQWTTNHRLRGLAYYVVRLEYDRDVFVSGRPLVNAIIRGAKLFDPRDSSTTFTNNWALVHRDYLVRSPLGCRIPTAEVPNAAVITAANISDEAVNLKGGGTQARYTADGILRSTTIRENNVRAILSAGAGQLIYQSAMFNMYAGAAPTVSINFDDGDLRGPISVVTRKPSRERTNRIIGVFLDEQNDLYEENNYPPVTNSTYVTEDDGEIFEKKLDLPLTQNVVRAQRIAKIELERARRQMIVQMPAKIKGLRVQAWSGCTLTNSRWSFAAEEFQVTKWNFAEDGGTDLELTIHDSNIYAWTPATDEQDGLTAAVPALTDGTDAPGVVSFSVAAVDITKNGTIVPVLIGTWTAPSALVGVTEVQFKRNADANWEPGPNIPDPQNPRVTLQGFLPDESIDVRVRHITTFGVLGAFNTASANIVGSDWIVSGIDGSVDFATQVTGAEKPDNNADVTSANVSSDTAAVDGTAAATVKNGAALGDTASQATGVANNADVTETNSFSVNHAWVFIGGNIGWTPQGATLTHQTNATTLYESTGADPKIKSPANLIINGSANTIVRIRLKRSAGSSTSMTCFYATSGHDFSGSYYKTISASLTIGVWKTIEFDMSNLTAGGSDWINNTITRLRLDLGTTSTDDFYIILITIGSHNTSGNAVGAILGGTLLDESGVVMGDSEVVTSEGVGSVQAIPGGQTWWSDTSGVFPSGNPVADVVITFYDGSGNSVGVRTLRGTLTTSTGNIAVTNVGSSGITTAYVLSANGTSAVIATITATLASGIKLKKQVAWLAVDISGSGSAPVTGGGK